MRTIDFRAMNCAIFCAVDSDTPAAQRLLSQCPEWFEFWEQMFSRFRDNSELCQLNRQPGTPAHVSPDLFSLIRVALNAAQDTEGLVNPTMLNDLEAAGYEQSFDTLTTNPPIQLTRVSPSTTWSDIVLDPIAQTVLLPESLRIDLGGFAKGWCAEMTVQRLASLGPALANAGGDIAISDFQKNHPWPVAIENINPEEPDLALLSLGACGVATSGRDYRAWTKDGRSMHHILDSRSHSPVETDVLRATVIANNAVQAEVAAKMTVILGSQNGSAWLEAHSLAGFIILDNGEQRPTSNFEKYIWK